MKTTFHVVCPKHQTELKSDPQNTFYICPEGCKFEIKGNIPRFVPTDNYAKSFGLQWNRFRLTQLDSYTGLNISQDRLTRIAGGSLDIFQNRTVLEAGCGAGRFTEIMLQARAKVFATDLSAAVEANYQNNGHHPNVFICQADLMSLPILPEQFDIVICIGVIQHTPIPEETIKVLCSYIKPGGLLLIDHYSYGYPFTPSRKICRAFLLKRSELQAMRIVEIMVNVLWPLHRILYKYKNINLVSRLRSKFLYWSPIIDYHDSYAQLGDQLMYEWARLDTHDALTDYYKHLRTKEEIEKHLISLGMTDVFTTYAGNGVEARARKPEKV